MEASFVPTPEVPFLSGQNPILGGRQDFHEAYKALGYISSKCLVPEVAFISHANCHRKRLTSL